MENFCSELEYSHLLFLILRFVFRKSWKIYFGSKHFNTVSNILLFENFNIFQHYRFYQQKFKLN